MATPIHDPDQGDYRFAQQCGADNITAENVAVSYRLDGPDRPIERIGDGWAEFGLTAGTVLEDATDVEGMRELLAGRDPHTGEQLVKPKLAVAPEAKLPAAPFVAALETAAAERGVSVTELVAADPWSVKRVGRLERGLKRDGEHHRAPVADLSRVAAAAGIDPRRVYGRPEWKKAWDQREARVRTGVMGYDVTFDRPKGISVLQGLASEDVAARMERIHLEAVRESVTALQKWVGYAMSGHHGDGQIAKRLDTSGLIGTMTVHRTARPVDGQPGDPHLHTHVMLSNLARGEDGKWRTIAAGGRDLMRHIPAVGELYRALEREKLSRELGIQFERDPATGRWDVVGIPGELKTTFSRRQAQIQATVGTDATPAQGRTAARATARAKVASTPTSERASWRERAQGAGHNPDQVVAAALGRDPGPPTAGRSPGGPDQGPLTPGELTAAVWDPEHGVTARTKVVSAAKVMAHVAGLLGTGLPNAGMLEVLTDHVLTHGPARALPARSGHMSNADRYTSADIVAAEETITAAAHRRRRDLSAMVHLKTIMRSERAWERKKGFRLSKEQRRVVRRLTFVPHGIDTVVGVAGAGKTTIMSAARAIWESAGYKVEGAANAAVAAAGLRAEAGIDSGTVASLLQRIETGRGLQGVHVLVLDEAATIDDRALAAIVTEADRTKTKIVGIGDPLQARSVGAGGSFARIHEIVEGEVLTENRRQRGEIDRKALSAWRQGGRRSALALWGENGMIHAAADADAAHRRITASWAADRARYRDPHMAIERLAVLAATNADVDSLNARIREAARTDGRLRGEDTSFRLAGGRTLELAAGDQVRVRQNDYRSRRGEGPDVLNGYRGLVVETDQRQGVHVEWRAGGRTERAWIDPDQISQGALSHGYATTVASAQGMTVDRAHVYGLGADAHTLYPAMSRARERVDLYLPANQVEPQEVRARLGEARTDEEALHRTISAYANTLTDGPEGMVLDELAGGREVRQERERAVAERAERAQDQAQEAPTPWQPLSLADANAGRGPAARQAVPEVAELNERRAAVEQALPDLVQRAQEAEARAEKGRLALLLEGTTRSEAQADRDAAREEVNRAATEREQLRAEAQRVREQALAADRAQAQADRERAQRETVVAQMTQGAPVHDLTRQELHRMDSDELSHVRTRQVLQASGTGPAPTSENRIQVPAAPPQPSRADQVAEMTRAADAAEYQRRMAAEIEEEDAERRRSAELDADLRRQQIEQQQREYAERMAAQRAAERSGPEMGL